LVVESISSCKNAQGSLRVLFDHDLYLSCSLRDKKREEIQRFFFISSNTNINNSNFFDCGRHNISGNSPSSSVSRYLLNPSYSILINPNASNDGLLCLQPFRISRKRRYPKINLNVLWASVLRCPLISGFFRYSMLISYLSILKPIALNTASFNSASWRMPFEFPRAARRPPRMVKRKIKSLKCPDCRAASCRLSVNPSNFLLSWSSLKRLSRIFSVSIVVAEERPSPDNPERWFLSFSFVSLIVEQWGQKRIFPGI